MRHGIVAMVVLLVGLSVASWLVGVPRVDGSPALERGVPVLGSEEPEPLVAGATEQAVAAIDPSLALPDHLVSVAPVSASLPETISTLPTVETVPSPLPTVAAPAPLVGADPSPSNPAPTPAVASGDAAAFLTDLNALRGGEGISPLARRAALDSLAQAWAETMAADGSLRHSEMIYEVIAGSWTAAGENVGYGPSASAIFAGLKASPAHLDNMVNPAYTSIGIGAVRADGVLWTAHLFAG